LETDVLVSEVALLALELDDDLLGGLGLKCEKEINKKNDMALLLLFLE